MLKNPRTRKDTFEDMSSEMIDESGYTVAESAEMPDKPLSLLIGDYFLFKAETRHEDGVLVIKSKRAALKQQNYFYTELHAMMEALGPLVKYGIIESPVPQAVDKDLFTLKDLEIDLEALNKALRAGALALIPQRGEDDWRLELKETNLQQSPLLKARG